MPSDRPLTPLRVALRGGAEVGLARAMADTAKPQNVGAFIEKRLSGLAANDVGYLQRLASAILKAGELISSTDADEPIEPDGIPTNGDAFGDEWEGKRVKWFGEWNIPGEDEWYKFSGTFPDIPNRGELERYAAELAFDYVETYPTRFIKKLPRFEGEVRIRIIGIEKAF